MTTELFCEILGDVREEFVLEAWEMQETRSMKKQWIIRLSAIAAVLCMLVGGGMLYRHLHGKEELPMLTLGEFLSDGMGFEGLIYRDASELTVGRYDPLVQGQNEFSTLPVYQNKSCVLSTKGIPVGLDTEEMQQRLERAAAIMGIRTDRRRQETISHVVYRIYAEEDGVRIYSDIDGTIGVVFQGGMELPEQYHFTGEETTDAEAREVIIYLIGQYSELLAFAQPEIVLEGDRDIYGRYHQTYKVYDASGNAEQQLLNYYFHSADFNLDDGGKLRSIRIQDALAVAEKIGDYPIITEEEARQKLFAGDYLTTVPYPVQGKAAVVMTQLVYRDSRMEENYLPYYRFYVELPEDIFESEALANGLKQYGAYYVPAVSEDYLSKGGKSGPMSMYFQ